MVRPPEGVPDLGGQWPNGYQQVDAGGARMGPHLPVEAGLLGSQLEHVAEHPDATAGRRGGQIV